MNIDDLMKLVSLLSDKPASNSSQSGLNSMVGKKCIIRTYSAGNHYGEVIEKEGKEVILKNARRLWYWKTVDGGISLSEIANKGVHTDSKICAVVDLIWLEAIEIIPCTRSYIK